MTVEEILAALQAIIDENPPAADAPADAPAPPLTEDQVARYEALEVKLRAAQASEGLRLRHAAYGTAVTERAMPGVMVGHASTKKDETELRAFEAYLRTGKENSDISHLRAQSEGVPTEGGYTVPQSFRDKLIERQKAFGGVANVVEQLTTTDGRELPWPTVDDTANLGEIVQEGGSFSAGADIVFGEGVLGAYSYMGGGAGSAPLKLSKELVQDTAVDVQGLVSRILGTRIARIQAQHIVKGTGSAQPLGITVNKAGIALAANTGITYNDLVDMITSVDPAYRESGCRWAFNDKTFATIKKIADTAGNPIWRPADANMAVNTQGGSDLTLLGYPVTIDQAFPDISLASNTVNWGVFGNLSEGYVKRDVQSVEILVNPYSSMYKRQIEYSAWARMDATQQNTFAYSTLTGHNG